MAGKAPIQLSVEGDGLKALQRKLKAMEGGKLLARELNKGLREAAKPLIPDARAAARSELPKRGGLAEQIATSPMRVAVSASKREPGVKIIAKGSGMRGTNRGLLGHPVFADAKNKSREQWTWVKQPMPAGWFDKKMKSEGPKVRPHLEAVLERVAEKIARA